LGVWGLGIGPNPQSPIPNPQSPIPNPHELNYNYFKYLDFDKEKLKNNFINKFLIKENILHKRESYKNEVKKKSSNKSNNTFINKKIVCEECKAIVKFKNSFKCPLCGYKFKNNETINDENNIIGNNNNPNLDNKNKNKIIIKNDNKSKNNFINLIIDYFKNYQNKSKNIDNSLYEESLNIDIHSPLFDILINEDFYKNIFTIIIPIGNIKTNKIANNYINTFNKLNQDKTKYLSLFVNYKSDEDIEFLSKLNINFNVIKKLIIYNYNNDIYDRDEFLNFILSFQFNSLVYLEIKAKLYYENNDKAKLEKKIIEGLISMKTLKEIKIDLNYINSEEISKTKGLNNSVEKLNILWNQNINDCILHNLQNNFINISSLFIVINPNSKGKKKIIN